MPSDSELLRPDLAISVRDLHVRYRTTVDRVPTIKTRLKSVGQRARLVHHVDALKGVSFDVPRGRVFGVIGGNGAGKSTLLRTIAGILPPSEGQVAVRGKAQLLALGLGFNKKLSGRENIFLGGLAAEMTPHEIEEKFEAIADFADIGDFIELPLTTYSSGMFSRLAFSVAVHMDPDILLIDEALSAGDAAFKTKAKAKLESLVGRANTIVVVSHGLGSILELADDCLWIDRGRVMERGAPVDIVKSYTRYVKTGEMPAVVMEDL